MSLLSNMVLLAAFVSSAAIPRQDRPAVPAAQAREYVGRAITVEGTVAAVRISKNGTVFLDLERRAPRQALTVVIYPQSAKRFEPVDRYTGKLVHVTGTVARTSRGIEMVVDDPARLELAPEPGRIPCN